MTEKGMLSPDVFVAETLAAVEIFLPFRRKSRQRSVLPELKGFLDKVPHQHRHGNAFVFGKVLDRVVQGLFKDNVNSRVFCWHGHSSPNKVYHLCSTRSTIPIVPPSLPELDALIAKARSQAQSDGLKRSDINKFCQAINIIKSKEAGCPAFEREQVDVPLRSVA